jgi:GNAT superfamily N-acetyltransferase
MQTGRDFHEEHVLSDGTRVTLRHLTPDDRDELHAAFHRLSPESRYRRFFAGMGDLDEHTLDYLMSADGVDHVAIVAATDTLDMKGEQGLGIARFIRLADEPHVAEVAVTVVDDQQGKGLGTLLLGTAARAAVERGITHFRAEILATNGPMLQLLQDLGVTMQPTGDGTVLCDVTLSEAAFGALIRRLLRVAALQVELLLRKLLPPGRSSGPLPPSSSPPSAG